MMAFGLWCIPRFPFLVSVTCFECNGGAISFALFCIDFLPYVTPFMKQCFHFRPSIMNRDARNLPLPLAPIIQINNFQRRWNAPSHTPNSVQFHITHFFFSYLIEAGYVSRWLCRCFTV
ncbi:hypothetical protein BDQ94DRAFT_69894 [Aspergillus welwitschiae]|uniref:Uncharacterized protein n=1 Tax=Aspergillus welwitschiae TaxID=1341132 RepID=A0A3F3QEW7_9EURO|nr:hypothetical protein BDQ94DRAFT_69894 [Aspergillus welwitschiae]RDH37781.1 hypothetical protein BDQ94DRAFT_69894 [Aspergillus welwitschiae]